MLSIKLSALDVDLGNLEFDFGRDWRIFREGRVPKFLKLWAENELTQCHRASESVSDLMALGKLQGRAEVARRLLSVLEASDVSQKITELTK